jgi:hypothetical protein
MTEIGNIAGEAFQRRSIIGKDSGMPSDIYSRQGANESKMLYMMIFIKIAVRAFIPTIGR